VDVLTRWAEVVDAYRVVPRVLVFGYGVMLYHVSVWFMALADPTGSQAAFASTVFGAAAAVFGLYTGTGRKWP